MIDDLTQTEVSAAIDSILYDTTDGPSKMCNGKIGLAIANALCHRSKGSFTEKEFSLVVDWADLAIIQFNMLILAVACPGRIALNPNKGDVEMCITKEHP